MDSIRTLLSIAAADDTEIVQFDVKTAFLYGTLDEDIYMDPPQGLEVPSGFVCHLKKSLYGLKQASRFWNKKFNDFLTRYDLLPSSADPCVYVSSGEPRIITTIVVDDGLAICPSKHHLDDMICYLKEHFEITQGSAEMYVGLHISRDRKTRRLWIDQTQFISNMIQKYGYGDAHPVSTPMDCNVHLQAPLKDDQSHIPDYPYQSIVGSLLYCATITRADIATATTTVAKFSSNYTEIHCTAVKRILKYLRGTTHFAICYSGSEKSNLLTSFSDADYAGDLDDRKSRSGCILMLNHGPISWLSCKQQCTASSTTESEYIAACLTAKETVWSPRLLADMGYCQSSPTQLFSDNQAAIRLVANPKYHKRTKHIDVVYHLIREFQEHGEIIVSYVHTADQLADILTKALPRTSFSNFAP